MSLPLIYPVWSFYGDKKEIWIMNLLSYVMVRQEDRDPGNKFSMSRVIKTQDFYVSAVLSWVISSTSKSEDKQQARSWMGDPTDAVENAASLFVLILNHCPSGITDTTASLTQNVLWATYERELGGITHLKVQVLTPWREQVILGVRLSPCSLEWFMSSQHHWKVLFLPLHTSSVY